MAKFRKQPVVVEAFQWYPEIDPLEVPEWLAEAFERDTVYRHGRSLMVTTLNGVLEAREGDWLIPGDRGAVHLRAGSIFQATYGAR